jgi:Domain of unknown function (DUF4277)
MERATPQAPARRLVPPSHASKALGLNGLGFLHHPRYLVPHCFQHQPRSRRLAPGMQARHLHDDTLGRALATLYAVGVTALSRLIAAPAATRWGLPPRGTPLDRTSFHVDGRSNSDEEPGEPGLPLTRGSSREQRPALNHGRLALMVAHQAGMPGLLQPLKGQRSDTHAFGQLITAHRAQLPRPSGTTCLGAARALSSAETLPKLAETRRPGSTRGPAPWRAAQAGLARAAPHTMAPLPEGERDHIVPSRSGGVAHRWGLIHSAPRLPQVQPTVDTQWRTPRAAAGKAFQTLGRPARAWAAEAHQALARLAHDGQPTLLSDRTSSPPPPFWGRFLKNDGTTSSQR